MLASEKYAPLYKGEVEVGEDMAFICYTDSMVPYIQEFKEGFCDGTFQTCGTRCFYQKLTVFGKVEVPGQLPGYLPLFHVFMTAKTQQLYTAIFSKLRELVPGFRPNTFMADFERALRGALSECFPGARICGWDSDDDAPPPPAAAPPQAAAALPHGSDDLQVIGRDSVEAVLQGLENPDDMLQGVLQDMGVGMGDDSVFHHEEQESEEEIVPSSQPVAM